MIYSSPRTTPPWITRRLLKRLTKRNRLYTKAKSSNSPACWRSYRKFHNDTLSLLHALKHHFFRTLSTAANPLLFWSAITKLPRKPTSTLQFNDSTSSTSEDKANVLNNFFSSCYNRSVPPLLEHEVPIPSFPCPANLLCTSEDIHKLLLTISLNKAPGPDASKVLERHIHNFLHDFCITHNILSPSQYGFRPRFSTETALLFVTCNWFSSLNTHKSICAVFFDLAKRPSILICINCFYLLVPPLAFHPIFSAGSQTTNAIEHNKRCNRIKFF